MKEGAPNPIESPSSSEVGSIFDNITFTLDSNGNWKSSAKNRKVIVLKGGPLPKPGESYSVEIIQDTNPDDPKKGKYIARIHKSVSPAEWQEADKIADKYEKAAHEGALASRTLYGATRQHKARRENISEDESLSLAYNQTIEKQAEVLMADLEEKAGVKELLKFRFQNLYRALKKEKKLKKELDKYLTEETKILKRHPDGVFGPDLDFLDKIRDEKEKVEAQIDSLTQEDPESHYGLHLRDMIDYKEQLSVGKIVETPYVENKARDIVSHLRAGIPVLLHGHLGSGKTELAMHVARKYILNGREDLKQKAAEDLARWEANHPGASKKEIANKKKEYEARHSGALILSGSRYTSLSELYGHQVLSIEGADDEEQEKKLQDFMEKVDDDFHRWEASNKNASDERKKQARDEIKSARLAQLEAQLKGGTVSKFVLGEVYKAMKEGRPLIIDEVNAIPHEILISLNHILTRRPGERVTVQQNSGQEDITIKEGFVVMMTGNLNQGSARYKDREDLDPAFLSRLHKIEYDYLPQQKEGEPTDNPEGNELYDLIISRLLDEFGGLKVPEKDLSKLWELAKVARLIQDVFAGKEVSGANFRVGGGPAAGVDGRAILSESVLSMRAIGLILQNYMKGGNEYELDYYIWNNFIAESTKPTERAYLYTLCRAKGLFSGPGWPAPDFATTPAESFTIDNPPKNRSGKKVQLSPREVIRMLYGNGPERKKWPERKISKAQQERAIREAAEAAANAIEGGVDEQTVVPQENAPKSWTSAEGKTFERGKIYLSPKTKKKIKFDRFDNEGNPIWVEAA